jgi:hypothetical protein
MANNFIGLENCCVRIQSFHYMSSCIIFTPSEFLPEYFNICMPPNHSFYDSELRTSLVKKKTFPLQYCSFACQLYDRCSTSFTSNEYFTLDIRNAIGALTTSQL